MRGTIATLLAVAAAATVAAQQPVTLVPIDPPSPPLIVDGIEILPVQGQVYLLSGAGANVTAQIGEEGVLLVDTGAGALAPKIVAAVQRLTPRPIRFLINTNADPDHVGGNAAVVQAAGGLRGPKPQQVGGRPSPWQNDGIMTVAHENAATRMGAGGPGLAPLTGDAIPESTFFTARKEFFANHEAIQVFAQPAAHTDGDVMVLFRKSDVVSTGDVFSTTSYPVIDAARGGSVQGVIDALNNLLDLTIPERNQMGGTRVVPGHGRICNEAEVVDYRDMVTIVRDRVQELSRKGMTLAQIKAAKPTLEYDGLYSESSGGWTSDRFLDAVYRDVAGKGATR
jgi:glyoxylase-like metal-dependent hydrolase (beta-lactamase superfamily II)